jgi:hypothetical protein
MLVKPGGVVGCVNPEFLNAISPMVVTLDGNLTCPRLAQP